MLTLLGLVEGVLKSIQCVVVCILCICTLDTHADLRLFFSETEMPCQEQRHPEVPGRYLC